MPKSLPEVDKSKLFMVVPSIYLNTNQNATCVGPFWGSRTSVGADVDGRVVAARLQQQQVHGSYHDPRAPPDCFPGSVGCRHEDRGPDTPSCLSSCLPIRCSPNPPICSFPPQCHFCCTSLSLLLERHRHSNAFKCKIHPGSLMQSTIGSSSPLKKCI